MHDGVVREHRDGDVSVLRRHVGTSSSPACAVTNLEPHSAQFDGLLAPLPPYFLFFSYSLRAVVLSKAIFRNLSERCSALLTTAMKMFFCLLNVFINFVVIFNLLFLSLGSRSTGQINVMAGLALAILMQDLIFFPLFVH